MLALDRVDPDLCRRLLEQLDLFRHATIDGTPSEIEEHGAASCRGYEAAARCMMDEPDDAYLQGYDPKTGCRVVVGHLASRDHVLATHEGVTFLTTDEVAVLLAESKAGKAARDVKQLFPGAQIIRRYQNEGCSDYPGDPALEAVDD